MIDHEALNALADALAAGSERKRTDAPATVTRIDQDGTVWVHVPGGVAETPARSTTAGVSVGDVVRVNVENGALTVTGNTTAPSASVQSVERVDTAQRKTAATAQAAAENASSALDAAEAAQAAAQRTASYFWHDSQGAHVSEQPNSTEGNNVLIDSDSVDIRKGEDVLASFGGDGVTLYDENGAVCLQVMDGKVRFDPRYDMTMYKQRDDFVMNGWGCKNVIIQGGESPSTLAILTLKDGGVNVSPNLSVWGNITAMGHSGFIGAYEAVSSGGKSSFASGTTWAQTGVAKSMTEGRYVVVGSVVFSSNATGRRGACIGVDGEVYLHSEDTRTAVNGAVTRINTTAIVTIVGSGSVQLMAFQNSGSTLSVADSSMRIIRIA